MNKSLCMLVVVFIILAVIPISAASTNPGNLPLIIVDSSKEPYGSELKSEIAAQLGERLSCRQIEPNLSKNVELSDKEELDYLAKAVGSDYVLIVDILPVKVDFREALIYKSLRTDATLRVRLYKSTEKQYILNEDIAGQGSNTTLIPWTSIGKKPATLEGVHKAAAATARKLGQILVDVNK